MQLTAFFLLACALTVSAHTSSQTITFSGKDISLEAILHSVEKQTGFTALYDVETIRTARPVTIRASQQPLLAFLDEVFKTQPLTYTIESSSIIITGKKEASRTVPVLPTAPAPEPVINVEGRITNDAGDAVVASIIIKGTKRGATSNEEGWFWLNNVDERAVLLISGVGIETKEVLAKPQLLVTVQVATNPLDEFVFKGYYGTSKRLNTGNVSKVSSSDIGKQPVQNPLAALQGRVAGLDIVQTTGVPGGSFTVRIRGTNSLANGNDPLFIIDGVPYTSTPMTFIETAGSILGLGASPLSNINPADIESIEVLKDADATAIYGSRGSNGVILITTKKGKMGKTSVNLNFYTGAGKAGRKLDVLNTQQYLEMRREAFKNDHVTPDASNARDLLVWDTTRYTDLQKELIGGTAHVTDAQLSISGGERNTQFSAGVGYHRESTVFPGNDLDKRMTAHLNITSTTPNKKLRTVITANYTLNHTNFLNRDLTQLSLILPPNVPALFTPGGDLNWTGWEASGMYENPVSYLKRRYEARTNNLIASAEIGYMLLPKLEIKSRFGYTNATMDQYNLVPLSALSPDSWSYMLNTTRFGNSKFRNWMAEPQLNWKPAIGNSRFDVLIGTQFLDQVSEGLTQDATGFNNEALMKNIAAAPNRTTGTNYFSQYRYNAVFGRISYTYDNRYVLNVTGRRDGSSRFGPGKQFANFGAAGAAWVFTGESFIRKALPFLSFGKLRASYGTTGSDQLTDYQYLDAYTSSWGPQQGVVGLAPLRLSNPEFAWEINRKFELGLETGFFKDRLLATVSYYRNRSSNQLVATPLPPTTGFINIQANFPATVQNTGLEIELNTVNLRGGAVTWTTALNISIPRNKLISFPGLEKASSYNYRYIVGEPLTISKVYQYRGLNTTTGVYEFDDLDKDGDADYDDKLKAAWRGPRLFGGLQNSIGFKGWQLDFHFQFVQQKGNNYLYSAGIPGYMINQPVYIMNRWQKPGDNAPIQRLTQQYSDAAIAFDRIIESDYRVTDASFIRLKNVALSYSLPARLTGLLRIAQARLFFQAQNLFIISPFKGIDPETQSVSLPPLKMLTGGFSLTF